MVDYQMPRQPSQIVQTYGPGSEYNQWQLDWNKRYQERQDAENAAKNGRPDYSQEAINAITNSAATRDPYVVGGAAVAADQMWNSGAIDNSSGYFTPEELARFASLKNQQDSWQAPTFDYSDLDKEKIQGSAAANTYKDAFARNASAYDEQLGGGYAGGIINSGYAVPYNNQISSAPSGLGMGAGTDPSMPSVAMPWAQPWGTPGFGQPGQGNSQGVGGYNPTGSAAGQPAGDGWGGPFGAKNPWSPA